MALIIRWITFCLDEGISPCFVFVGHQGCPGGCRLHLVVDGTSVFIFGIMDSYRTSVVFKDCVVDDVERIFFIQVFYFRLECLMFCNIENRL